MQPATPSRTALGAAVHRAAHQVLESGKVFADPLALRILGTDAETLLRDEAKHRARRGLRFFIAARSRLAEDAFAAATARGVRQLVILGAGLDTFAYRVEHSDGLRVFEVDHPATQAWKRQRLAEAAIAVPASLGFVPVDFERESLGERLVASGFDPARPSFFIWLGVVPYLSEAAVYATLGFIAGLPGGAHVVLDYANPRAAHGGDPGLGAAHDALAGRVAAAGEPFRSYFETDALHHRLRALGFREIEDLGPSPLVERYLGFRLDRARDAGGHVLRATTLAPDAGAD